MVLPVKNPDSIDPDFAQQEVIRIPFNPFQQKVCYRVEEDTSISQDSDQLLDEDILFAAEQPYVTPTGIGFKKLLRQLPVEELAKRSDIMITSTLSMSLFAKDDREVNRLKIALMSHKEIREVVAERHSFNAVSKEILYQIGHTKDKEKKYRDHYSRSSIADKNYESKTLRNFKKQTKKLNSNIKVPVQKSEAQR